MGVPIFSPHHAEMDASTPPPPAGGTPNVFPFLKLPGEIRNQCYAEVLRLYEPPKAPFPVSKTAQKRTHAKHSAAFRLTQVCRQIRAELLPLVLAKRCPQVSLSQLAEYLQIFYQNAQSKESAGHNELPLELSRPGQLTVWTSRRGLHSRLPSKGVDLLPIIEALLGCEDLRAKFHSWCIFNWELHIVETLYDFYSYATSQTKNLTATEKWRADMARLGMQSILLQTKHGANGYPRGRLSSSITVTCKATKHMSEKKRVLDLAAWVFESRLRDVHKRVADLTVCFVTPKTLRGEATEVKFSVYVGSVKVEWWCRGSYCKARLVDNGEDIWVEKKVVEGKDVLRL